MTFSMTRVAGILLAGLVAAPTPGFAAPVLIGDTDFDLANYDVLEIETGDVTPLPQPDGIGRITVTRTTAGSTGAGTDGYLRIEMEGYDTTGSTGYGQLNSLILRKQTIDPAAAGGFASLTKNSDLAIRGPYAMVRNPMYLGRFFILFGFLMLLGPLWKRDRAMEREMQARADAANSPGKSAG